MSLPGNQTKIVCTIGPASSTPAILEDMIRAGMNVARLNFSHGNFDEHAAHIQLIRAAQESTGRRVAIMADLSGPKMRIGHFETDAIELQPDAPFCLTTEDIPGTQERVSVSFEPLPGVVKEGDTLFLNDGLVQLKVLNTEGQDVNCRVLVGGKLSSRKGLNLPGIDLGMSAFTPHDKECLSFALERGVDAISQSFVETAADVEAVREATTELGAAPFIIAKIERAGALDHLDEILEVADGIMIARGDLGVEIPIERIAGVQKAILRKANLKGTPVITATQMLESMTHSRLPTRAEATDVANAVLDGTDAVMLSGESAVGKYPVDAVRMLARITDDAEDNRSPVHVWDYVKDADRDERCSQANLISLAVETVFLRTNPVAAVVRTGHGFSARSLARFRLPVWAFGVSIHEKTCQDLQFSYGVFPVHVEAFPEDWSAFSEKLVEKHGLPRGLVVLAESPTPERSHMGLVELT